MVTRIFVEDAPACKALEKGSPATGVAQKYLTKQDIGVLVLFVSEPADIDDLSMLAEFAQLAMDRARAASARAEAVEAEGGDPSVHLIAFDRMGRAMRLALSLRRRFAGEAQAQAVQRVQARKERLKAALTPAIRIHAPFGDRQELDWALAHRLETEADAFATMPFEAGLARLNKILGLPAEACAVESPDVRQARGRDAPAALPAARLAPDLVALARQVQATGPP